MTVAAIVERDGRFLMIEEETSAGLRWNQPAGHLEPGESLLQAVVRETLEESAHPLTPAGLLGVYLAPGTGGDHAYLRFAFVGQVGERLAGRALDTGIERTFWASAEELRRHVHLHRSAIVMRCVEDYLSMRAQGREPSPLDTLACMLPDDTSESGDGQG